MSTNDKPVGKELSQRDLSVLEHIFDDFNGAGLGASSQLGSVEQNATCAQSTNGTDVAELYSVKLGAETYKKVKELEFEAVQIAEKGASDTVSSSSLYTEAISKFSEIITLCPEYASAWNNRAQAYRMSGDIGSAIADLDQAIKYGHLVNDSRTLSQAYTQRGLLRKSKATSDNTTENEAALSDLESGAKYGNQLAKKLAVAENPYAKMCAAMVKEMLTKLE